MDIGTAIGEIIPFQNSRTASLRRLERSGMLRHFRKGEHVFYDQEEVENIYGVVSGMTALYKMSVSGEKKVVFVYGKGYLLNEVMFQELPASINCEVLEDAWILAVPRTVLLELMEEDHGLMRAVLDSMAMKIRRMYRQLKNTSNSIHGDKKIAAKLWKLQKDYGRDVPEGREIAMDLNITYLADMVGSKRETVSRQVKTLVENELLLVRKNRMIIRRPEALRDFFRS